MSLKVFALLTVLVATPVMAITSNDIEPYIKQMEQSGQINSAQAAEVRQRMQGMSATDWVMMEVKARQHIQANPEFAEEVRKRGPAAAGDLSGGLGSP